MKTFSTLILIIFSFSLVNAQHAAGDLKKRGFALKTEKAGTIFNMGRFRKQLKKEEAHSSFSLFHHRTFQPTLSVDLLEGSGIHLFTLSNIDPLPVLNVGAKFKAGIIITI